MTQANLLESNSVVMPRILGLSHQRRMAHLAWPIGQGVDSMAVSPTHSFPSSPSFPRSSIPIQNLQCRNQQLFGQKLSWGPQVLGLGALGHEETLCDRDMASQGVSCSVSQMVWMGTIEAFPEPQLTTSLKKSLPSGSRIHPSTLLYFFK